MARLHYGAVWLAFVGLVGCSTVVDFDRSKIDADGGGIDASGSPGDGGPRPDARVDGAVGSDGGPEVDAGDDDAGLGKTCATDDECQPNELCCESSCKLASPGTGCASCNGTACGDDSNSCSLRECSCGGGTPCDGPTPFCEQVPGGGVDDYRCVACRGDTDCPNDTLCINNECRPCDASEGNDGCENPTPICAAGQNTCVACDANNPCPTSQTCVAGSCYGCVDGTNDGCQPDSTTPICDPVVVTGQPMLYQCEGCANDDECAGNATGARCIATGACRQCDPADTPAGGTNPACGATTAAYCDVASNTCRACTGSDCTGALNLCAGTGNGVPQALRGLCVECTTDQQCPLARPECNRTTGRCGACTDDEACVTKGASLVCGGGQCVDCVSDARGQCSGSNQCNTTTNMCVDCTTNAGCPAGSVGRFCNTQTNTCQQCVESANCGNANASICDGGSCGGCTTNAQCTARNGASPAAAGTCLANGACGNCNPSGAVGSNGCTSATPFCTSNQTCVACRNAADCNDENACTTDACTNNVCVRTTVNPNDNNQCTTDTCNPTTGVSNAPGACTAPAPVCVAMTCRACDPTANVADMTNPACPPMQTCTAFACVPIPPAPSGM